MRQVDIDFGFFATEYEKKQVIVGCTNSPLSAEKWIAEQPKRLPHYVIDRNGEVFHLFNDSYYSNIVNVDKELRPLTEGRNINQSAITILLANAGACKMGDYRYVYEYCSCSPYRGCRYYEMYTTAQLKALRELLQDLLKTHGITYRYSNRLGDICKDALQGNEGVFLMTAFSRKTNNPHPQYELLKMFKELARWVRL